MSGVNTKQKTVYGLMNGVDTKMKSGYALIGGVNTKVYTALSVGDSYTFGGRVWFVLDINDSGQALLFYQTSPFSEPMKDTGTYASARWGDATMNSPHSFLNTCYDSWLSAEEKAKVVTRHNPWTYAINQLYYSDDTFFMLSNGEIFGSSATDGPQLQWFAQHNTDAERATLFKNSSMWTRSGREDNADDTYWVGTGGQQYTGDVINTKPVFAAVLINP